MARGNWNKEEARRMLRPGPARRLHRTRYLLLCSYSPFRYEMVRLYARSWLAARWLAYRWVWRHQHGEAHLFERRKP